MPHAKHPIQYFNGVTFYLKQPGYFKACFKKFGRTVYMHRFVWEHYNGPIPEGLHVHHIDHDRANNAIENLTLITAAEHTAMHGRERWQDPGYRVEALEHLTSINASAKAWHSSPAGTEWHSRNAIAAWERRVPDRLVCAHCGDGYLGFKNMARAGYCSQSCTGMARKKTGVDDETRVCVVCSTEFRTNKYGKTKTCSQACSTQSTLLNRRARAAGVRPDR